MNYVQWCLDGSGYRVTVYSASGAILADYSAGNHPLESTTVADLDSAVSEATLIRYAESTAAEMAAEFGAEHVSRDTNSEESVR
jgi:hypothetical protein